jgi:hypothetical protein
MPWALLTNRVYRNLNLLVTASAVKVGSGYVHGWHLYTTGSSERFVKFYDKATAPLVGVDTPKLTIGVKPNSPEDEYVGEGIFFQFGIWISCVTGLADNNTSAPSANTQLAVVFYE